MFLPEVGKGEIRRLLLRVPGFGRSSKQVNSSFILVLLENWSDRKRDGKVILRNSFQKNQQSIWGHSFPGNATSN